MNKITKSFLVEQVGLLTDLCKVECEGIVDTYIGNVKAAILRHDIVPIRGLGNLIVNHKAERPGRNPKTGEDIPISARYVVTLGGKAKNPTGGKYIVSKQIRDLSEMTEHTIADCHVIVHLIHEWFCQVETGTETVEIRNFGSFKPSFIAERRSRNPKTGEKVIVPPSVNVLFTPGKELKDKLNHG